MAKPTTNMEIEVHRGQAVESRHQVSIAVSDTMGRIVQHWGDPELACFPRSAVKPLQTLPLIESGAAAAFGLGGPELSFACASHGGEPIHIDMAKALLARAGLGASHLACGAHWPLHVPAAEAMMRAGEVATPLHNNCSGEHIGMLLASRHLGEDVEGYLERSHPAQRRIEAVLAEMCDIDLAACGNGLDGCSAPVFAISLKNLALGMARFAQPDALPASRAAACRRLRHSIAEAPMMIAGTGRFCTIANEAFGGDVIVKTGAEGVFCAALVKLGLGLALKVHDGATRAAEAALVTALDHLGALNAAQSAALQRFRKAEIRNWNGRLTGHVLANLVRPATG